MGISNNASNRYLDNLDYALQKVAEGTQKKGIQQEKQRGWFSRIFSPQIEVMEGDKKIYLNQRSAEKFIKRNIKELSFNEGSKTVTSKIQDLVNNQLQVKNKSKGSLKNASATTDEQIAKTLSQARSSSNTLRNQKSTKSSTAVTVPAENSGASAVAVFEESSRASENTYLSPKKTEQKVNRSSAKNTKKESTVAAEISPNLEPLRQADTLRRSSMNSQIETLSHSRKSSSDSLGSVSNRSSLEVTDDMVQNNPSLKEDREKRIKTLSNEFSYGFTSRKIPQKDLEASIRRSFNASIGESIDIWAKGTSAATKKYTGSLEEGTAEIKKEKENFLIIEMRIRISEELLNFDKTGSLQPSKIIMPENPRHNEAASVEGPPPRISDLLLTIGIRKDIRDTSDDKDVSGGNKRASSRTRQDSDMDIGNVFDQEKIYQKEYVDNYNTSYRYELAKNPKTSDPKTQAANMARAKTAAQMEALKWLIDQADSLINKSKGRF